MSLIGGDLTTLATAKSYIDSPPVDAVLSGLITRISRMIQTTLQRPLLLPKTYTEQFSGTGTRALILPNWPITAISSLKISGVVTPISAQPDSEQSFNVPFGYRFNVWNGIPPGEPALVELVGFFYEYGHQNVVATYKAGYEVVGETQTVDSSTYKITPKIPYGSWATDETVTYAASGIVLTPVVAGPLTARQYIPPNPSASSPVLNYQFSSADAGQQVVLNYGYIPGDIEQVCLELVAERASYRKRVGVRSQSLGGQETISYETFGLSGWAIDALMPYVNVLPPALGTGV